MANLVAGSNTMSSAGTTAGITLDPTARTTTALLNFSGLLNSTSTAGGGTCDVTVQVTYDTWPTTQVWTNLSTTHYSSGTDPSTGVGQGVVMTITGPIAGLRLFSSTFLSSGSGTAVVLKALQAVTAGP